MSDKSLIARLDHYVKFNKNVLFTGLPGVGKTAVIKETFERHNLKWLYFSAPTMDPWVDFIGVPKEKIENKLPESFEIIKELTNISQDLACNWVINNWKLNANEANKIVTHVLNHKQGVSHLELVRPWNFANDNVEALLFDEFNRASSKVLNAVLELLQFKSINGFKFKNLRLIWAAINPDNEDDDTKPKFAVNFLDDAFKDRFHVTLNFTNNPDVDWFREKYGQRIADSAIEWWRNLPVELKPKISPRRLQYALDAFKEGGDITDFFPQNVIMSNGKTIGINSEALKTKLLEGPFIEKLKILIDANDTQRTKKFLLNENNYNSFLSLIEEEEDKSTKELISYFLPLISKEKMAALMNDNDKICRYILKNMNKIPVFKAVSKEISTANTNPSLVKKIRTYMTENQDVAIAFAADLKSDQSLVSFVRNDRSPINWTKELAEIKKLPKKNIKQKIYAFDQIVLKIPKEQDDNQALETLEILNLIFDDLTFASTLSTPPFIKLPGIINHCIDCYNNHTGENITEHGERFTNLFEKIKQAGLKSSLYIPECRSVY